MKLSHQALLYYSLLLQTSVLGTSLIDSNGKVARLSSPIIANKSKIVTKIRTDVTTCQTSDADVIGDCLVVEAGGVGIGAAANLARVIVLKEKDMRSTLASIVTGKLQSAMVEDGPTTVLMICEDGSEDANVQSILQEIYDFVSASSSSNVRKLDDVYRVEIVSKGEEVEDRINDVLASFNEEEEEVDVTSSLSKIVATGVSSVVPDFAVLSAQLTCDDAYARLYRSARAKALSPWKNRVIQRGLIVDKFGSNAISILEKVMTGYDVETVDALKNAAEYRLKIRAKLQARLEDAIVELFESQMANLEKTTLKKFNSSLLKQKKAGSSGEDYDANAAAVRAAAFDFETAAEELEVVTPLLSTSLRKTKFSQDISDKLNAELANFAESNSAKMKDMMQIQKKANKRKGEKERSIEAGLGLVAMLRPDGFGNLQGFAGYSLGPHNVIVGVHNDADAPETINQFGGVRPPLLRVQPKLNLDIEL